MIPNGLGFAIDHRSSAGASTDGTVLLHRWPGATALQLVEVLTPRPGVRRSRFLFAGSRAPQTVLDQDVRPAPRARFGGHR
jgi:hypothetical protein